MRNINKKIKNDNYMEKLKDEFSLDQREVFEYGRFLLNNISKNYDSLIDDSDACWSLDIDIEHLKKLITIIVRLQNNKILREK